MGGAGRSPPTACGSSHSGCGGSRCWRMDVASEAFLEPPEGPNHQARRTRLDYCDMRATRARLPCTARERSARGSPAHRCQAGASRSRGEAGWPGSERCGAPAAGEQLAAPDCAERFPPAHWAHCEALPLTTAATPTQQRTPPIALRRHVLSEVRIDQQRKHPDFAEGMSVRRSCLAAAPVSFRAPVFRSVPYTGRIRLRTEKRGRVAGQSATGLRRDPTARQRSSAAAQPVPSSGTGTATSRGRASRGTSRVPQQPRRCRRRGASSHRRRAAARRCRRRRRSSRT